jgi:hypothetical protein
MPFNPARFRKSFIEVMSQDPSTFLKTDPSLFGQLKTPKKKAEFIKDLILELMAEVPTDKANHIMQGCGKQCIGNSILKKARTLFIESQDMGDFIIKLNEQHIGGGRLNLRGNLIEAGYDRCYCGSVSAGKERMSLTYCYCSTGWYKRLFEEVLSRPVQVEILQSIINGADTCRFLIHI